jgi:hypothetical protein
MKKNLFVVISLVIVGIFSRLIPHWPNFTPVLASALFAGVYIKDKKLAFLVPLITLVLSDIGLGFYADMIFVYVATAIAVLLGTFIKKPRFTNVLATSIVGSVLFFAITNFGAWAVNAYGLYASDLSGLAASYTAALPFAANQWLPGPLSFATNGFYSDLVYNGILFSGYAMAQQYVPALKPEPAVA